MTDTTHYYCAEAWAIYDRWTRVMADDPCNVEDATAAMTAELAAHVKACTDCK